MNTTRYTITNWIDSKEATALIKRLVAEGRFEKSQLKKSSCKFTNGKDKSDGYQCKVFAFTVDMPDGIEVVQSIKSEKVKIKTKAKVEPVEEVKPVPAPVEEVKLTVTGEEEERYIGGIRHIGRKQMDSTGQYYEVLWVAAC